MNQVSVRDRGFSSLVERIAGEGTGAWAIHYQAVQKRKAGEDVIILSLGDPDFDTPPAIVDQTVASLRQGHTHYASGEGESNLLEAVAARHSIQTGCSYSSDQVVILPGAQCGLFCTALCLLEGGDEALVPHPRYVTYEAVIRSSGATMVDLPLHTEKAFHLDPEDLLAAITPKTRVLLLNNPHNPSGAHLPEETLLRIAEICAERKIWIISDEVYGGLTFDRPFVSMGALAPNAARTVVVSSLSKTYAMTGFRLGWAVGPEDLIGHIRNLIQPLIFGMPVFIQDAAVTALTTEIKEVAEMKAAYTARRDLVWQALSQLPNLRCLKPESSMFMMLDVRDCAESGEDFAQRLLDAANVAVLPAESFGPAGAGHVRLSLNAPPERLTEACQRIAEFMRG